MLLSLVRISEMLYWRLRLRCHGLTAGIEGDGNQKPVQSKAHSHHTCTVMRRTKRQKQNVTDSYEKQSGPEGWQMPLFSRFDFSPCISESHARKISPIPAGLVPLEAVKIL